LGIVNGRRSCTSRKRTESEPSAEATPLAPLVAALSPNRLERRRTPNPPPMNATTATTRWMAPCQETGVAGTSVGKIARSIAPTAQTPSRARPLRNGALGPPARSTVLVNAKRNARERTPLLTKLIAMMYP
jgi:hypothetical protein